MDVEIVVPYMGMFAPETTKIKVAKWYKKSGDYVKFDERLVEVESEFYMEVKNGFINGLTLEINAPAEGILKFTRKVGKIVKIGQVLGKIQKSSKIFVNGIDKKENYKE